MENTPPLSDTLQGRIKNTSRLAIVGIGDELLPADRPGMYAAREIERHQFPVAKGDDVIGRLDVLLALSKVDRVRSVARVDRPDGATAASSASLSRG